MPVFLLLQAFEKIPEEDDYGGYVRLMDLSSSLLKVKPFLIPGEKIQ